MPFQLLRNNAPLYILHKEKEPYMEIGQVISVTQPKAPYPNQFMNTFFEVDIVCKVGNNTITYQKIPAMSEIADFGNQNNIVISCSRESMSNEITSLKKQSEEILNSIDLHKNIIECCDKMLLSINPEFAERKQLSEENALLKARLEEIEKKFLSLEKA